MSALLVVAANEPELCPVDGARRLCCGIGPVEAALATARALAEAPASAVLQVGIGGASALEPGTVVLGSASVYADVLDDNSLNPRVASLACPAGLLAVARATLPDAVVAPIATTARVGGAPGYGVEAMEGFGVLRAAALAGVPALEVRVVSNRPDIVDRARWQIEVALRVLHEATRALAPAPAPAPALQRAVRSEGSA